jgi:hypothetical protein
LKRQSRTGKYDPKRSTKEAFTNTRGWKAVEARRIVVFRANTENGEGGSKREFEEVKLERRKNQMKYTPSRCAPHRCLYRGVCARVWGRKSGLLDGRVSMTTQPGSNEDYALLTICLPE